MNIMLRKRKESNPLVLTRCSESPALSVRDAIQVTKVSKPLEKKQTR